MDSESNLLRRVLQKSGPITQPSGKSTPNLGGKVPLGPSGKLPPINGSPQGRLPTLKPTQIFQKNTDDYASTLETYVKDGDYWVVYPEYHCQFNPDEDPECGLTPAQKLSQYNQGCFSSLGLECRRQIRNTPSSGYGCQIRRALFRGAQWFKDNCPAFEDCWK